MSILHNRRKTDQLIAELARAHTNLGVLHATSVLGPPIVSGDLDTARKLCRELIEEAAK